MKDLFDLMKEIFPVEVLVLLGIFIYLLIFLKRFYQEFLDLSAKQQLASKEQAKYIQERLNAVEQYLGINDKALELRKKQAEELSELAEDREKRRKETETKLKQTEEELEYVLQEYDKVETEFKTYIANSGLEKEEKERLISDYSSIFTTIEFGQLARHELKNSIHQLWIYFQDLQKHANLKNSNISLVISEDINNLLTDMSSNINSWTKFNSSIIPSEPNLQKIELKSEVSKSLSMIESKLRKKGIMIEQNWPKKQKIYISGVANAINHIFLNLLINSGEFAPDNSLVSINIQERTDDFQIHISNPNKQRDIKDPNLLFKAGYTTNVRGSGFGLYVTKRLVENCGGEISISVAKNIFTATVTLKKWSTSQ